MQRIDIHDQNGQVHRRHKSQIRPDYTKDQQKIQIASEDTEWPDVTLPASSDSSAIASTVEHQERPQAQDEQPQVALSRSPPMVDQSIIPPEVHRSDRARKSPPVF